MRISLLFLGRNGAGPKYSYEIAKALLENEEISLQVIIPHNIDNLKDWKDLQDKFFFEIEFVKTYSNIFEFLLKIINVFNYFKISKKIKKNNPEAIYIPMGSLLCPGVLVFLKRFKKIYTLHDPILHLGEKSIFIEFLRKTEIKYSDKIVILNEFYKKTVEKKYNVLSGNIEIIPHAGFFRKEMPSFENVNKRKILFIGRIEQYKGIDILLDALSISIKTLPDIILTIAGKGNINPYKDKIKNVEKNVTIFNRWLSEMEIEKLISENDFLILPYIDASQSGVIPLAFGNGKTVLVTNVGALSEQVPDDIGFCVKPDPTSISEKILEIYDKDSIFLNQLNKKAYQYALDNLTWSSSAKKLLNFIKK